MKTNPQQHDLDREEAESLGVPERFVVNDEASANWVVRRIVEARAYKDRVAEWAQQEAARAEREEAFFLRRYGGELEAWLRRHLAATNARQRSVPLPAGRVGLRRCPAKLVVEDEAAVIEWATRHLPAAVTTATVVKLSKSVLHEHLESTGELPEHGARLEPPTDRLTIR